MDFIRATIKTVFYDYPIGSALYSIRDCRYDEFTRILPELMRWTIPDFTTTEIFSLKEMVCKQWIQKTMGGIVMAGPEMSRIFLILNQFSKEVFSKKSNPTIVFDNLLRWNSLTRYLGEDILVCSYLAETDLLLDRDRKSFVWDDVLPHDNKEINQIIDKGLADVHAHLFASSDIFAVNWISLMNRVEIKQTRKKVSARVCIEKPYQDFDISVCGECNILSLHQLGVVAAAIRVMLCRHLYMNEKFDYDLINDMIQTSSLCIAKVTDVLGLVADTCRTALSDSEDKFLDYAIQREDVNCMQDEDITSPYMMHFGERRMLYQYFRKYYGGDSKAIELAPLVYLYVLIKNKFRREFVQTNPLIGFENFKRYQDRKNLFLDKHASSVSFRYAVQSTLGKKGLNSLEARVSEFSVNRLRRDNAGVTLFNNMSYFERDVSDNIRMVVHFLKKNDCSDPYNSSCRYSKERQSLRNEMYKVLQHFNRNNNAHDLGLSALVGIDAAGAELNCRPELFAPLFRWAKISGLTNLTYHAGEDFYDLIDGLRTIEEAMFFMQYERDNRIGHALALGINPHQYYAKRHFNSVMPIQYMLDNMVWLYYKARDYNVELSPETIAFIDKITYSLFASIGYGEDVDRFFYWMSMRLRGDRINAVDALLNSSYGLAAQCMAKECIEARKLKKAVLLHEMYETDSAIRSNGACPDSFVMPKTIADDVFKLQEAMMDQIEQRDIFIECCPSSNLVIGPFSQYKDLPLLRFMSVSEPYRHRINISINTDDRGVFATSLRNEYSLMAIAMTKMIDADGKRQYSNEQIIGYLDKISQNAKVQRFDVL